MSTNEIVTPAVGQVWQDNDPRVEKRYIRVEQIEGGVAVCTAWYPMAREVPPRKVRIKLARFRPTSSGYRFINAGGEQ